MAVGIREESNYSLVKIFISIMPHVVQTFDVFASPAAAAAATATAR